MGEMADLYNECYEVYNNGFPSAIDYFEENENPITYKKCKYCGKEYLTWKLINNKWRLGQEDPLAKDFKIHQCPINLLSK